MSYVVRTSGAFCEDLGMKKVNEHSSSSADSRRAVVS